LNEKDFHFSLDEKALICKAFAVIALDDGTYDVFVVEATLDSPRAGLQLELAVVSGPRKGDVVRLHAQHLHRDPLDLLGLPGTLVVTDGQPSLTVD
jgi:hypothetical protein